MTCMLQALEQTGSEQESGSKSKVDAPQSSGSTMEPKEEGQPNSGATRKQVPLHGSVSAALEENILVGRDSDADKVIDLVLADTRNEYVCVYGVDGIGKTAFIRSICQNEKLHGMFERIATLNVPDPLNYHDFLRTVKRKLDPKKKRTDAFTRNKGNMRMDERAGNVPLPDRRSKGNLIIIDDVSSKKELDVIKPALLEPQINMSRVIITTREPSVAELFDRTRHDLKALQDGYPLELFKKKVLSSTLPHCCATFSFGYNGIDAL